MDVPVRELNITEPHPGVFQVRIRRGVKRFDRTFSEPQFGSRSEALESAISYRDSVIAENGKATRFGQKSRKNKTTGIHGVHNKIKKSSYYPKNLYLVFVAHYKNAQGKVDTKEFSAGNIEKLDEIKTLKVLNICRIFRAEYEASVHSGSVFSDDRFRNWRSWNEAKIAKEMSRLSLEEISVTSYPIRNYHPSRQTVMQSYLLVLRDTFQ